MQFKKLLLPETEKINPRTTDNSGANEGTCETLTGLLNRTFRGNALAHPATTPVSGTPVGAPALRCIIILAHLSDQPSNNTRGDYL